MYEYIYLGSSPAEEECAQVGQDGYHDRARKELSAFLAQIRRIAEANAIDIPEGMLRVKRESHEYGSYFEAVVRIDMLDENAEKAWDVASKLEDLVPGHWDDIARKELGLIDD
jgi:hypothetical protein